MTRPTLAQLAFAQAQAAHHIHIGSFWLHQTSGTVYEVTGHHIREADGEPMVEYRPTSCDGKLERIGYGEAPIADLRFSRPVAEFFEKVFSGPQQTGIAEAPPLIQRFTEVTRSMEWVRV